MSPVSRHWTVVVLSILGQAFPIRLIANLFNRFMPAAQAGEPPGHAHPEPPDVDGVD